MLDDASRTAEVTALIRASDRRWDPSARILDDPYAERFLGPLMKAALRTWQAGGALSRSLGKVAPLIRNYVLARHRFIDEALGAALAGSDVEQVVVLGAGYDSRAWRFAKALHGRPIFEVDHPATAGRKTAMLARWGLELPDTDRRVVGLDFEFDELGDKLHAAGFDSRRPSFFIWEGVSMYLTRTAVKDTLHRMACLGGPGSELCADFWFLLDSPDARATVQRMSTGLLHVLGEPVVFGIHPEEVDHFLQRLGWVSEDIADQSTLYDRYVPARDRELNPAQYVLRARRARDASIPFSVLG
ncbi:MAG: SAM-dependent methyltransferase [Myxococcota bacterium]|nr:SAM-dependent methyltransferase [Myxococcota bacterium]